MIVLDTSVVVDSLLPKLGVRNQQAGEILRLIRDLDLQTFAPKILKIELTSVLSRKEGKNIC